MKSARVLCVAAVLATVFVPANAQAAASMAQASIAGLGDPFGPNPSIDYHPFYWSGAYAEAQNDLSFVFDDQYDLFGYPWPDTPATIAMAIVADAFATSVTAAGTGTLVAAAAPAPGSSYAEGYANLEHWIDFETTLPVNVIGVGVTGMLMLETDGPGEEAYAFLYGWAELQQWIDDGDGIPQGDEWYSIDYIEWEDDWFVEGGDDFSWTDGDEYWFAPFGPGVYSLGFGLEGAAGAAVPAPGALVLGGLGAGLVGWLRRRRRL